MPGETSTSVGPSASFYAVQHDLASIFGRPDEASGAQEVDLALEEKRRKARERQRRERPHPRFSASSMISPDVTPDAPYNEQPVIGLIGMGEMGKMYAKYLSKAGWMR
jgi:hypothetical protein